jgi:dihydroorotase
MQLILRHGRVIDPSQEYDRIADLGIEDGRVAEIAPHISTKGRQLRGGPAMTIVRGTVIWSRR